MRDPPPLASALAPDPPPPEICFQPRPPPGEPVTQAPLGASARDTIVVAEAAELESTTDGAAIMDDSEDAELTDEQAWEIVKDFINSDHVPPAADLPVVLTTNTDIDTDTARTALRSSGAVAG